MAFSTAQIAQFETAKQSYINELVTVAASPSPNYTIGNRTMSKGDYMAQIRAEIDALDTMINEAEDAASDAWEETSTGYC